MQRCNQGGEEFAGDCEQEDADQDHHDAIDDDLVTRHWRLFGLAFRPFRLGAGSGHWGPSRVLAFASAHLVVQESC